jgi:predicted solute-binding protein
LEFADALRRSRDWGLQHTSAVIDKAQRMHSRPPGFYEDYYDCLKFEFDEAAQKGLGLFFEVAKDAGLLSEAPALEFVSAGEPLAVRAR